MNRPSVEHWCFFLSEFPCLQLNCFYFPHHKGWGMVYSATSLESRFSVRATICLFHRVKEPNFRSLFAYVYSKTGVNCNASGFIMSNLNKRHLGIDWASLFVCLFLTHIFVVKSALTQVVLQKAPDILVCLCDQYTLPISMVNFA